VLDDWWCIVQVVQGDMEDPDAIFQQTGHVDGVFSVQNVRHGFTLPAVCRLTDLAAA